MSKRTETLSWNGMPHRFVLMEDAEGVHGTLTIEKLKGTQVIPVAFPEGITLQGILDAWAKQNRNWVDLFPPIRTGSSFVVVRLIDLGEWRILWFVLHEGDVPQDACTVQKKPQVQIEADDCRPWSV